MRLIELSRLFANKNKTYKNKKIGKINVYNNIIKHIL